jgi:PD-(D/E)XK nuclease superfamily
VTYSYTQISQCLGCPRRYRNRYLDGWQEKDTRAAMLFGRAFEQAVAALFRRTSKWISSDGSVSFPVSSFSTSRLKSSFGSFRALCNQVAQSKCWPSSARMSNQG